MRAVLEVLDELDGTLGLLLALLDPGKGVEPHRLHR